MTIPPAEGGSAAEGAVLMRMWALKRPQGEKLHGGGQVLGDGVGRQLPVPVVRVGLKNCVNEQGGETLLLGVLPRLLSLPWKT